MTKKTPPKTTAKRSSGSVAKSAPPRDQIDPRKALLAQVAGNIAAPLVGSPSPTISSADAIATVAVDIAEQILLKAGVTASVAAPAMAAAS